MKKHALTVAVAGALGVLSAQSATVTEFDNGVLVPFAIHGGSALDSTAVGLTSCAAGVVYWAFWDVDTVNVLDGEFPMTAQDQFSYIWAEQSLGNFQDQPGYLTFVLDTNRGNSSSFAALDISDSPCLAGAAFQVDIGGAERDVAFLPAIELDASAGDFGPLVSGVYEPNLQALDAESITDCQACGANWNDVLYLRYFIDGAPGGNDSSIIIWSSEDISGDFKVQIYDDDQNRISANMTLPNKELNILDPEDPASFGLTVFPFNSGFVLWDLIDSRVPGNGIVLDKEGDAPEFTPDGDITSFTIITSDNVGASQTVLNPILNRSSSSQ